VTIAPADFDYLSGILRDRSAIVLEPGKEYLATARLTPVCKSAGLASIADLVSSVRSNPRSPLIDEVIDAMTTNETLFFRDVHPFDSLRDHILPELIEARRAFRSLNIWCAASSSGQEPYSMAMLLRERFPELAQWQVRITATDLSPTMVERAKLGRYSQLEVNRGLPAPLLVKYFARDGAHWMLDASIRSLVEFHQLNLIETWPTFLRPDLVMIRNGLIYFDAQTKAGIFNLSHGILSPAGVLMVGSSETVQQDNFARHVHNRTSYFRPVKEAST